MKKQQVHRSIQKGFSLLEMALVLLILGVLLGGLMMSLGQSANNARRTTTTSQLQMIQEALYGFAQTNGRLPCPATATSLGYENITNVTSGSCATTHGFIPNVTLGLTGNTNTSGQLLDTWQNPLRYSVASLEIATSSGVGTSKAFTSSAGLKAIFASPNTLSSNVGPSSTAMLSVCSRANCAPGSLIANSAPAVILSMGANWPSFTSTDENQNAGSNNDFVSAGYSEENFDDILLWLSPHILYTRLIEAEQLP